jgi:hypothetical protein
MSFEGAYAPIHSENNPTIDFTYALGGELSSYYKKTKMTLFVSSSGAEDPFYDVQFLVSDLRRLRNQDILCKARLMVNMND